MTITELLLAALQTKFPGVDAAILTRIAKNKAEGVTDENAVNSIVEGIAFQDVLNSYGDFRAGDARLTAIRGYEKQHNLKDGKPMGKEETIPPKPEDDVPGWAKELIASNKTLRDEVTSIKSSRAAETRSQQISSKAKEYGIPDALVPMLNISDDADIDAFMKDAKQTFINVGLSEIKPPEKGGEAKTENEEIAGMISARTKEIVESKK